jgi:uncharacterized protein involved in outer membrane biogenesis
LKKGLIFRLGLGFCILLALLAALPLFLPLDSLTPRLSQEASTRLGVPVKLAGVRLQLLPTPRVVLEKVEIGARDLEIDSIALVPALGSLLSQTRVMRLVNIKGMRLRDTLFARLPAGRSDAGPLPVGIEQVRIADLRVGVDGVELAVDSLVFAPQLHNKGLSLGAINARLYGGELNGQLKLDWPREWLLEGQFSVSGLDVATLARAFVPRQSLSGRLTADARLAARAAKPAGLADALAADGKFSVAGGVLYNFDFASAVKSVVSGKVKGGETRFDEFHGNIAVRKRSLQLRQLAISSGVLAASGRADIQRNGQITGVFDVDLKNTMGVVGVPVAVSGTVKEPQLGLTAGAKIGAAVGTVLAPGFGTSLGVGIGRFFERKTEK